MRQSYTDYISEQSDIGAVFYVFHQYEIHFRLRQSALVQLKWIYRMATLNEDDSWGLYKRLIPYLRGLWKYFAISVAAMLVVGVTGPAFAALIKPIINEGFVAKNLIAMTPYAYKAKLEHRLALEQQDQFKLIAQYQIYLFQKK